jgi:hypothetical protein
LIDEGTSDPAIDAATFPETPSEWFWTANPLVGALDGVWRVSFLHGYTYDSAAEHEYQTRCVR